MFKCGHTVGVNLSVNYAGMGTDDLDMVLNQAWAEAGLGHLFVLDTNVEKVIVKVENLLEIGVIGKENNCDFTSGCLAGVLEGLLQQPYSVAEDMVGEEERVFTFEKTQLWLESGKKHLTIYSIMEILMVPIICLMEY